MWMSLFPSRVKRKMGHGTTLGVYLKAISSSGSLLFLLLLHFHGGVIATASATLSSLQTKTVEKCDKVVSVETVELLSYLGNVTFTVPTPFQGRWTTLIKFTSPYTFIGGWGVEVQSFGRKGYAVFQANEDDKLEAGDEVIFQFRVLYGWNAKVPKVLSIRWEDVSICGPPIMGQSLSRRYNRRPLGILTETISPQIDSNKANITDNVTAERKRKINTNAVRLLSK